MNNNQELEFFFNKSFPENKESITTYLDIVNIQTKENINSRIYQYYLTHPIISEWFIFSLTNLIEQKTKKYINLKNYIVFTEYTSKNNKGRIDLVIESKENKSVIIIENKIHHWLHNDLNNYWETFNSYPIENKIGIVLALSKIPCENENFITITHLEWISKVKTLIREDSLSDRERIHLEDFIINIEYITNLSVMNDNIKFYLDHSVKIEKAIKYKEEAARYILSSISVIATKYNWSIYGNTLYYKQIWDEKNNIRVFYTLFPELLLKEKKLKIVIEIDGDAREYYEKIKDILEEEKTVFNQNFFKSNESNKYYGHIGYIVYQNLDNEDFKNFENYLKNKIEELEPKRKIILSKLYEMGYKKDNNITN